MEENKDKIEKIKEKIRKLLLKADSTNSPEEAESLLVKANVLMMKFKIEESQINLGYDDEPIKENQIKYGEFSLEGAWETDLVQALCYFLSIEMMWNSRTKIITVIGSQHDCEMAIYFFESARRAFRRLSREAYLVAKKKALEEYPWMTVKQLEKRQLLSYRSVYIRSFLFGARSGLEKKLLKMKVQTMHEYDVTGSYGLILTNQLERANKYMMDKHKPRTQTNTGAQGDADAVRAGLIAGGSHTLTVDITDAKKGYQGNVLN